MRQIQWKFSTVVLALIAVLALGITGGAGIDARDTNRVELWRDFNVDGGGFIKRDKLWWYGSYRRTRSDLQKVNFPVKPQVIFVIHRTGKATYNLT